MNVIQIFWMLFIMIHKNKFTLSGEFCQIIPYPGYSKNMNAFPKKMSLFDNSEGVLMIDIPEKVFGLFRWLKKKSSVLCLFAR